MKIGVTGSTCSGKTTFIDYLRFNLPDLRKKIELVTERASECPYPLNEKGGFRTQWWIQSQQIAKEYDVQGRADVVITDRTVFDSIPYLMISSHSIEELRFVTQVAKQWNELNPYNYILYFAVIPKDRLNLSDGAHIFQHRIDKNLRTIMSLNIDHKNIIYIPYQEKEKRCENVLQLLNKLIG